MLELRFSWVLIWVVEFEIKGVDLVCIDVLDLILVFMGC